MKLVISYKYLLLVSGCIHKLFGSESDKHNFCNFGKCKKLLGYAIDRMSQLINIFRFYANKKFKKVVSIKRLSNLEQKSS